MVYPKTGLDIKKVSIYHPQELLMVSSILVDRGYNVKIIDQRIEKKWSRTLLKELKKQPLLVGLSVMTGSQIRHALEISKFVKQNSDVSIVWGGIHPSLLPLQTIKNPYIDIIIKGEGEEAVYELAVGLEKGKPLKNIRGLVFKNNNKIMNNPERFFLDLNKLPPIPYHLINIPKYLKLSNNNFIFVSSKGCPHQCGFCCNVVYSKSCWRSTSVNKIVEQLDFLIDKYSLEKILFYDENFLVNKKRVYELSKFLNDKVVDWEIQARVDDLNKYDVGKLHARGLSELQIGVESGNNRILSLLQKKITRKQVIDLNKKLKIRTNYNFIIGFPTETKQEILDSVSLALKLLEDNPFARISAFYIYTPYPKTPLFHLAVHQGFKPPNNLEGWAGIHRHKVSFQKNRFFLYKLLFSSKFIDGQRINQWFSSTLLPMFIPYYLGRYFRKRWQLIGQKNEVFSKRNTAYLPESTKSVEKRR